MCGLQLNLLELKLKVRRSSRPQRVHLSCTQKYVLEGHTYYKLFSITHTQLCRNELDIIFGSMHTN